MQLTPRLRLLLPAAVAPALGVGLWLLRVGDAPRGASVMQAVAVGAGAALYLMMIRPRSLRAVGETHWLPLVLAGGLFVPLVVASQDGPARWLVLGGVRLYLAPILLPLALLHLGAAAQKVSIAVVTALVAAGALVWQPDAAQLTAFACAMTPVLVFAAAPRLVRLGLLGVLVGSAVVAWRAPDPLAPVPYVEGVFTLAAGVSPWALAAAVLAAALPVATLAWVARVIRSPGTFAAAVYFGVVCALAPLQVTPVPWLGFGAGPILGYFLVAGAVSRLCLSSTEYATMSRHA